jgi:acetyl-CoA carboxylase carboxyltransferase component
MGVEGSVNLGFKKELNALEGEARVKLFEKLVAAVHARNGAVNAASNLEIDDVIDPAETRGRLALGLRGYIGRKERRRTGHKNVLDSW